MDLTILGGSLYLACGLAIFLLGLLVYRQGPDLRLHRVSAAMLVFGGLGPALGGIGVLLGWQAPETQAAGLNLLGSFAYIWELFFPSLLLFALVFPREWPVLKRFPRLPWLLYAPHLFHLAFLVFLGMIGERDWDLPLRSLPGGESVIGTIATLALRVVGLLFELLTRLHVRFFSFINLVYVASAIALLAMSWRSLRSPKLKRQMVALVLGLGSSMALYAAAVPLPNLVGWDPPVRMRVVLVSAALLLGAGSIAFAIVRQSFLDLGTVMRRAILLSGISGSLVVLYFLTARPMDRILLLQSGREFPIFQTLFVILVIVFFHPILGRVEETVDRLVHGHVAGHGNLVRRLGRDMTSILDLPVLISTLVGSLKEALSLESVHVALLDPTAPAFRITAGNRAVLELDLDHPLVGGIAAREDLVMARDLLDEADSPESRATIREALDALNANLVVPIRLPEGGGCIGFLSLGPKLTGGRFNAEELTVLSILATQVGIAVRNARLHEEAVARKIVDQELAMARSIQEAILAGNRPSPDGLDLAAVSLPSRQVGGDYYDLIDLNHGRLGIAIGDVSGKGVPAALLMSMLHAGLHAQVNGTAAVADVARRMNRILYHATSHEKYATFFFGIFDPVERRFLYSNAGHNLPLVLRRDGTIDRLREGGLVLGVMEDASYREASIPVDAGDLLVLYTDGVTEATDGNGEEYGESRLVDAVRRSAGLGATEIIRTVREDVAAFSHASGFDDDFTLIVVRAVQAA
jgi:sigma-B regulation protein RsbU (phosphoserine phosphatase)